MVEPNDLPSATWNPLYMSAGVPTVCPRSIGFPMVIPAPRRIGVSPGVDLFHPLLPDVELDRVFAAMAACQMLGTGHRFTVVTTHAARMHDYLMCDSSTLVERWAVAGDADLRHDDLWPRFSTALARMTTPRWSRPSPAHEQHAFEDLSGIFPLPNMAVGVQVSTQSEVDERVPRLNDAPVAQRFVRATPSEPLDLSHPVLVDKLGYYPFSLEERYRTQRLHMLDWLSVGGPAGSERWQMESEWVDALMADCRSAGVPFLFRGWGDASIDAPVSGRSTLVTA